MADPPRHPDSESPTGDDPGTPRWVKVFGVIVLAVILLFVIVLLTRGPGGHGPGRHTLGRDAAQSSMTDHTPPASGRG